MKFTVIATSFNDSKEIVRYLDNIVNQSVLPEEIIIVDGGSKDDTIDRIVRYKEKSNVSIRIINNRGRLNIAEGYNVGVEESATDMILITGIGNLYDKNFCKELIKSFDKDAYDMVYCPTFGVSSNFFSKSFNSVFLRGKHGKRYPYPSNRAVLIDRNVFKRVGLFYEKFVYAGEDTEFYIRAAKHGERIGYTPNAKMYWFTPINFSQFLKKWNVNAIADLQLMPIRDIIIKDFLLFSFGAIFLFLLVLLFSKIITIVILIICVISLCLKFRSINIYGIMLRLITDYCVMFYHVKNRKYSDKMYRFDPNNIKYLE